MSETNDNVNMDTTKAEKASKLANKLAKQENHEYVTLEHLFWALCHDKEIITTLRDLNFDFELLKDDFNKLFATGAIPKTTNVNVQPKRTDSVDRAVQYAVAQAAFDSKKEVSLFDILIGILNEENSHAAYFLMKQHIDADVIRDIVEQQDIKEFDELRKQQSGSTKDNDKAKEKAIAILKKYTTFLNEEAKNNRIDPLIGRVEEVNSLIQIAARRTKNNVILVGEPGCGKTQLVEGFAKQIAEGKVPEAIANAEVFSLDIGNLLAGTKFRGDFEDRMKAVISALQTLDQPVLFIDEIHMIMGAGSSGSDKSSMDVANLLKPALSKGTLRCIGATTYEEYRKHFEKDRALMRRFQKIDVHEPSIEDTKLILRGLKSTYEEYHAVTYTDDALDAAAELSSRYITDKFLPDKAIDIIDSVGAKQRVSPDDVRQTTITVDLIEAEISRIAKIPARTVQDNEEEKLKLLETNLKSKVFGQDHALSTLEDAVIMSRAGMRDPAKPLGCYLFTGPTGTGKTLTAKTLAKTLGMPLVRFDMSEFMEKHTVSRLIGSPPGYVGYGDGAAGSGMLVNALEKSPHAVFLFDEIEKAHPDVFNIFLQLMDEGTVTSSMGKTVSAKNVFIIMTSNAGAKEMSKNQIGFGNVSSTGEDDIVINNHFSPEFRNRLDAVVKFNKLKPEHMGLVVDEHIGKLNNMLAERKITIVISEQTRDYLAKNGYDTVMGARPMARLIEQKIHKPISREVVFGKLKNGGQVRVECENNQLSFEYGEYHGSTVDNSSIIG